MSEGLRIVTFNMFPPAYHMTAAWAAANGHKLVLLVTSPAPVEERYAGNGYRELIATVPREQDILITKRMRTVAAPAIAALQPDLIISGTFPHRIPEEITRIPCLGAFNLHPAPLPRGRGAYPERLVYEGDNFVAATMHRIVPEFDAGAIVSQQIKHLPEAVTSESIMAGWMDVLPAVMADGVERVLAGEPDVPQDESQASTPLPFTEEERWLSFDEPALTVQRRAAALNLRGPSSLALIDGEAVLVDAVRALPNDGPLSKPGTVLDRTDDRVVVAVVDGAVEMRVA